MSDFTTLTASSAWRNAASYWKPAHMPFSAWWGHAPFAFWLVDAIRPRSIVELGTHYGFSYFVFCEAIRRSGLESRAYALDTWQGDDHASFYGEEVYESVRAINNAAYSDFSILMRGFFDDSLQLVADGSVDLLHIDGRHGLDDITHDFQAALPKMSDRGIIVFHDVSEHREGFGVWKFWEELEGRYPSFKFEHAHGLGVLGVGSNLPTAAIEFFQAGTEFPDLIRGTYERLGAEIDDLASVLQRAQHVEQLTAELGASEHALHASQEAIHEMHVRLGAREAEITGLRQQIDAIHDSTSWVVTRPLRSLRSRLRPNARS